MGKVLEVDVRLWRNKNGGSIGDAHGRREDNAENDDWIIGDMIQFYEGDDWRSYDHSIGNEAWYYAMGATCDKSVLESWTNGLTDGPPPTEQFEMLKVIQTAENILLAYIGFDHSNWRIVNRYDTVVTVPIKKMGYYHVGTEIWYRWQRWWWNEDPISYKICDGSGEDKECFGTDYWPDKIDPRIMHHHTTYFALSRDKLCGTEEDKRRLSGKRLLDLHA